MIWTDEKKSELTELWAAGYSVTYCGEHFGVTRNTIAGAIHRMRLSAPEEKKPAPRSKAHSHQRSSKFSKAAPVPIIPFIAPLSVEFLDLAAGQCRWPHGDSPPFLFCGNPASDGLPYCPQHCRIAYVAAKHRSPRDYDGIAA